MILIQSQNCDFSTNTVVEWLLHLKAPFLRINKENHDVKLEGFSLSSAKTKVSLNLENKIVDMDDVTAYWHRRGIAILHHPGNVRSIARKFFPGRAAGEISRNLNDQIATLNNFLNERLASVPIRLGNAGNVFINKLKMLQQAAELGIKVPQTIVTSKKSELLEFRRRAKNIISKGIQDSLFIPGDDEHIVHYTELITDEIIDLLPDSFAPSLFQEMVEKSYEVRIFYFRGEFYSMAIFSQRDEQTNVDFRKYNDKKPNRTVPYRLPEDVRRNLSALMRDLRLDNGSIDMVVTPGKEHYFLEINPVGQFGMVSYPCNFYLEKKIAYFLSGKIKSNEQVL
jgi:ATP-GRASP peptide maturase of grasp-with-spasm system